jgi:SAM-dependent methyltransferase
MTELVELSDSLQRLYRNRFSTVEIDQMRSVWEVLVRDFFQKRIDQNGAVLDVGAGYCQFINAVSAVRKIALDANPDLPTYASPDVEIHVTTDLSLDEVADESVQTAFMSNLLEHLPDYRTVLHLLIRIHRKLRPGGALMILQPNYRLSPGRYFDFLDHSMILTEVSLREALVATGYDIEEMRIRFLPFTSKSRLPRWPWLVAAYIRMRPAQWFFGKQTYVLARRPLTGSRATAR